MSDEAAETTNTASAPTVAPEGIPAADLAEAVKAVFGSSESVADPEDPQGKDSGNSAASSTTDSVEEKPKDPKAERVAERIAATKRLELKNAREREAIKAERAQLEAKAKELAEQGVLEKYGVRLIGASLEAINKAEDRQLFKAAMQKIGVELPKKSYPGVTGDQFWDRLDARLKALPGVTGVATLDGSNGMIPMRPVNANDFELPGRTHPARGDVPWNVDYFQTMNAGGFEALGAKIVRGRGIEARDAAGAPPVVVINEAFAKKFFASLEACGGLHEHGRIGKVQLARRVNEVHGLTRGQMFAYRLHMSRDL